MALKEWMLKNISIDNNDCLNIDEQHELFIIDRDWLKFLQLDEYEIKHLKIIYELIDNERQNTTIYPDKNNIHRWSYLCKPENVKVIIIGQDPYCDGRGCGLAFGTARNCAIPESLKTVFKELCRTTNFTLPNSGFLEPWCQEGILLLNTVFTVIHGTPMSHENIGWQRLSSKIVKKLSDKMNHLVFLLWGYHAKKMSCLIDKEKHLVLESCHPSPRVRSKYSFIGNDHFIKTNEYIIKNGGRPINWNIIN